MHSKGLRLPLGGFGFKEKKVTNQLLFQKGMCPQGNGQHAWEGWGSPEKGFGVPAVWSGVYSDRRAKDLHCTGLGNETGI